jgi:peroxin-5
MVRVLSENPKFRNSEFFDFMSKVSTGELKFENNDVVPGTVSSCSACSPFRPFAAFSEHIDLKRLSVLFSRYRTDHDAQAQAAAAPKDPLAAAWAEADATEQFGSAAPSMEEMLERAWREGEMNEQEMDRAFQDMMAKMQNEGNFDYDQAWGDAMNDFGMPAVSPLDQTYELETNNPFAQAKNAFDEGMRLFHAGSLRDAVLAFQAVVGKEPNHSEAWRMLGVVHQENDEDKKAILCLERAVEVSWISSGRRVITNEELTRLNSTTLTTWTQFWAWA